MSVDESAVLAEPLDGFLERLAGPDPLPAGGAASAVVAATAAGLVATTARRLGLTDVVASADRLRLRAVELVAEDVHAYERVLQARALPPQEPDRDERMHAALAHAADPPLEVVEIAAEVADLAATLAPGAAPDVAADAVAGVELAVGAARAAAGLVAANVGSGDDRLGSAVAARGRAAARATQLARDPS